MNYIHLNKLFFFSLIYLSAEIQSLQNQNQQLSQELHLKEDERIKLEKRISSLVQYESK